MEYTAITLFFGERLWTQGGPPAPSELDFTPCEKLEAFTLEFVHKRFIGLWAGEMLDVLASLPLTTTPLKITIRILISYNDVSLKNKRLKEVFSNRHWSVVQQALQLSTTRTLTLVLTYPRKMDLRNSRKVMTIARSGLEKFGLMDYRIVEQIGQRRRLYVVSASCQVHLAVNTH